MPSLPTATRLSDPMPSRESCSSESSEEEEEDDDDDYDDEMGARSPPVLTKPTLGLKCKVGKKVLHSVVLRIGTFYTLLKPL